MNKEFELQLAKASPDDRLSILEGHSDDIRDGSYFHQYDDDERGSVQESFLEQSILCATLEEKIKDATKGLKADLAEARVIVKNQRENLKDNGENRDGKTFLVANHEEGYMYIYDQLGKRINKRKLLANEKQAKIKTIVKTA